MTPLLPLPARMVSYIRHLIRACVSSIVMPSNLRTGEGRSGKGSRWRIRLAAKERSPDQATRRHESCWEADVYRAVQDKQVCWRIDEGKRTGYYFLFPITVLITISFCFQPGFQVCAIRVLLDQLGISLLLSSFLGAVINLRTK